MKIEKGNPLLQGVNKTEYGYNFTVSSKSNAIVLYLKQVSDSNNVIDIDLNEYHCMGSVYSVCISEIDLENYEYLYINKDTNQVIEDEYSIAVNADKAFGKCRKTIRYNTVSMPEYDWNDDVKPSIDYENLIIYKLHVRGFTKSKTCDVDCKGTFKGVANKAEYIKSLGFNCVELMPVSDYNEIIADRLSGNVIYGTSADMMESNSIQTNHEKINYWGYGPGNNFAVKTAFAYKTDNIDAINEFKDMVKTLHQNGIEVVVEMYFTTDDVAYIIQCIRYWVVNYHIDGVHLYGTDQALNSVIHDPLLSDTKIFTVYWNGNNEQSKRMVANYNDNFSNVIKKSIKGDEDQLRNLSEALRCNPVNAANINYIASHNGFTLWDMVCYDRKHNEANGENNKDGEDYNNSWNCGFEGKTRKKKINQLRLLQVKNALTLLMISSGTPLLMAGDEMLNSQDGNNNPYCIDSELSWVNWNTTKDAEEIKNYLKKLITYRKDNSIFHMNKELMMADFKQTGYPDASYHSDKGWYGGFESYNRHMGIMYNCMYADKPEMKIIYVAINLHWESHKLALPNINAKQNWKVDIETNTNEPSVIDEDGRFITVPSRSICIISRSYSEGKPVGRKNKIKNTAKRKSDTAVKTSEKE